MVYFDLHKYIQGKSFYSGENTSLILKFVCRLFEIRKCFNKFSTTFIFKITFKEHITYIPYIFLK